MLGAKARGHGSLRLTKSAQELRSRHAPSDADGVLNDVYTLGSGLGTGLERSESETTPRPRRARRTPAAAGSVVPSRCEVGLPGIRARRNRKRRPKSAHARMRGQRVKRKGGSRPALRAAPHNKGDGNGHVRSSIRLKMALSPPELPAATKTKLGALAAPEPRPRDGLAAATRAPLAELGMLKSRSEPPSQLSMRENHGASGFYERPSSSADTTFRTRESYVAFEAAMKNGRGRLALCVSDVKLDSISPQYMPSNASISISLGPAVVHTGIMMLNALESGHHDSCTICWNRTWVLPTNTDMLVQDMEIGVCEIGSGHKTIRASIHGNKTSHLVESVESEDPIPPFQASFNLDRAGLKLTMTVQLLNKSEQIASAVRELASSLGSLWLALVVFGTQVLCCGLQTTLCWACPLR